MVDEVNDLVNKAMLPRIASLEKKMSSTVSTKKLTECVDKIVDQKKLVHTDEMKAALTVAVMTQGASAGTSQLLCTPGSPTSPGTQMRRCVNKVSSEVVEISRRENNMIVLGLEEPATNIKDDAVKSDRMILARVFKGVLQTEVGDEEMKIVTRIGKKGAKKRLDPKPDESTDYPRAVKITFHNLESKEAIFGNISKLKGSQYNHLSLRNDMTPMQREEDIKIREKARTRENEDASGKFHYRVRGPPGNKWIAKINKETREEERMETSS